ncbi:hypothetical protein VM1G_04693 [Cytospora mali]|uniref:Uncharacterized protein n=1 Tax=Cytospora mali TaxID=578113 RepID=A0A194VYH7_CYTMA|nr:hypothetical protein VM1G_04693 [Valsa mali]
MRQNQAAADETLAGLQDQVISAQRGVDLMKTSAHSASIRITCDHEQSLARNKLLGAERRLHVLRLAAAGIKLSPNWQDRLMEGFKQQALLDQLPGNIATAERELSTLTSTMEHIPERVAIARGLDEKEHHSENLLSYREYMLSKMLPELNDLITQILTGLYNDTRHVRGMTSGMLRSLFQNLEDQDRDVQQTTNCVGADSVRSAVTAGTVLDKTLGINSALSYATRSGGERKRIDLALFFALLHLGHAHSRHRARYLLMDEVFDSLDATGQAVIIKWCRSSLMARMDFALVITHQ